MLRLIRSEELEGVWDEAYGAIEAALPEEEKIEGLKDNLLKAIKEGKMSLFVLYSSENIPKAVITTYIQENIITGVRELFIYTLYAFENLTDEEYQQGLLVLNNYAKLNKCHVISAYSNVDRILEQIKKAGGVVLSKFFLPVL